MPHDFLKHNGEPKRMQATARMASVVSSTLPARRRLIRSVGIMDTAAPTRDEFDILLQGALSQLSTARERAYIEARLIEPYQHTLRWEYGKSEPHQCWVFADMGERDVVAAYCRGGFGALGSPWGINFRTSDHFGMDCGWYRDLGELLSEWIIE